MLSHKKNQQKSKKAPLKYVVKKTRTMKIFQQKNNKNQKKTKKENDK